MSKEQKWFEMAEIRKRRFDKAIWIPLRASQKTESGRWGYFGHESEFFGAGSLAVPLRKREAAEKLRWTDLGLVHDHHGSVNGGRYISADEPWEKELKGSVWLVMSQRGNFAEPATWHVHPDLTITLGLKREGNVWLAIDEGYIEVIRLSTDENNQPTLLEVRSEHLKDYLCARRMALRMSWYRERRQVFETEPKFDWKKPDGTYTNGERWEGRIDAIHEGGDWYGSEMAVFHAARTNLDFEEDVPHIGPGDDVVTSSFTRKVSESRKLYRVSGEVWRDEWVEPGDRSVRIRRDAPKPAIAFVVDGSGKKQTARTLVGSGQWLWFKPEVIPALLAFRGSSLEWYTRETGAVRGSPDYRVPFGVNGLGLVNVYAKDVALEPEWLQRVWAGFNMSPEGKVSAELFSAQAQGVPAPTLAPESFLGAGIKALNQTFEKHFGRPLFRPHTDFEAILAPCHRFRALSESGLYALAKDLVRAVLEHIDTAGLHIIVPPPAKEKWGSLRSLENVLATAIGARSAHAAVGPLHGIYNLRLADAHLPSSELDEAYDSVRVDRNLPFVLQGRDLLVEVVNCLHMIAHALKVSADSISASI